MVRYTDYLYATVPSACLALPMALLPDLGYLQGIEKLGIVGIMAAGILFFAFERRSFIAKSAQRLEGVENRLATLETQVSSGNEKVVQLLGAQLDALRDIREGQAENFSRMWQMTLSRLQAKSKRQEKESPPDNAQPVS